MNSVAIFAALSLEAYINYYAVRYEIPFHKDTDRLSTSQKWNIYTNWKVKKSVKEQTIANIRKIFKLRNTLVHAKPELGEMGGDLPPEGKSGQAQIELTGLGELIIDLNSIYEDTFSIDPDESSEYKESSWLYALRKIS
ncbi:hypothetical protein ACJJH9_05115 [Microbulbifer sp. DLAB2-AF]|uniref:hypothetical protein n=1 Tax=Microbulbifer sp. DLAB2-AF TaxID=3243395 RepID=UPI004039BE70